MLVCAACGHRLIPCYPNQTLHPLCDPDPPGWTDQQLEEWGRRVDERKAREKTRHPRKMSAA